MSSSSLSLSFSFIQFRTGFAEAWKRVWFGGGSLAHSADAIYVCGDPKGLEVKISKRSNGVTDGWFTLMKLDMSWIRSRKPMVMPTLPVFAYSSKAW